MSVEQLEAVAIPIDHEERLTHLDTSFWRVKNYEARILVKLELHHRQDSER